MYSLDEKRTGAEGSKGTKWEWKGVSRRKGGKRLGAGESG